jgi:hypothetical protein
MTGTIAEMKAYGDGQADPPLHQFSTTVTSYASAPRSGPESRPPFILNNQPLFRVLTPEICTRR